MGILILTGIVRLPRLKLYWSTNLSLISTPGISNIMPKTKFEQLFRVFHLNDNSKQVPYGQDGHDKLFKVRKLLTCFVRCSNPSFICINHVLLMKP